MTLRTGSKADQVFISVHDNGKGIAAEVMPLITEAFFSHQGSKTARGWV